MSYGSMDRPAYPRDGVFVLPAVLRDWYFFQR